MKNMNKYETIFIISSKITKEQREDVINKITDFISKNGKIIKEEDLGEKNLAYEVRENKKGFYYVINFETKNDVIVELERIYRITEEIIKFITMRVTD